MGRSGARPRLSVDVRTRGPERPGPVDPGAFFETDWRRGLEAHGERAAADAGRLGVEPLALEVDGRAWTLRLRERALEVVPGRAAERRVGMDPSAFADWVRDRKTALGLVVGRRVDAEPAASEAFGRWDPVLRAVLDGRALHRPGEIALRARDGSPLDLARDFRLGERPEEAAHFLAEAGFLLLKGVFAEDEIAAVDADLARAVEAARPDDGASWWAATRRGERYPCRILGFEKQSASLRELLRDPRFLAIGELLDDGHRPGDPFGEHFRDVSAEGLVKRVDSVEGLACLPWHKDCERGGHSIFCSGITVGICLTPVDAAHGGLDVIAGSHRAHLARSQLERGIDLPTLRLRADRGDLTVHLSCALHRSTHPARRERRVAYTGFALPRRAGEEAGADRETLERERFEIGAAGRRP